MDPTAHIVQLNISPGGVPRLPVPEAESPASSPSPRSRGEGARG